MAMVEMDGDRRYRNRRRANTREYRLIFCLVYPQFLVAAIAGRVTGRTRVAPQGAKRSVFAEARAAAASCIPFAFR